MREIKYKDLNIGIDWDFEERDSVDVFLDKQRVEISLYDGETYEGIIERKVLLILERESDTLIIRAYEIGPVIFMEN